MGGDAADSFGRFEELVYLPEDSIDSSVAMPADTPPLNDAGVVTIDLDMLFLVEDSVDSTDKELKTEGLCPTDVPLSIGALPTWEKSPGMPSLSDDNANSNTRTGI